METAGEAAAVSNSYLRQQLNTGEPIGLASEGPVASMQGGYNTTMFETIYKEIAGSSTPLPRYHEGSNNSSSSNDDVLGVYGRYLLSKAVTELLMYANHALNFFLYCATGRKFRQQVRHDFMFLFSVNSKTYVKTLKK